MLENKDFKIIYYSGGNHCYPTEKSRPQVTDNKELCKGSHFQVYLVIEVSLKAQFLDHYYS